VTGYIAGDALYALHEKHPDYEYSALVRTQEKADVVKKAFPNIRIVLGGNDDSDLLKEEAAKADVVLRIFTPSLHKHHATSN
jgi:N-acetyl-gamma-glutamylphosphate reductase